MNETLAADLSEKEIFPIVDEKGNVIGKATRKECHSGSRLLHPVVHLHVLNANGDIYLQKRSIHKFIQPGKWDTAVGGHMDYGETVEQALARETREELGFTDYEPKHLSVMCTIAMWSVKWYTPSSPSPTASRSTSTPWKWTKAASGRWRKCVKP